MGIRHGGHRGITEGGRHTFEVGSEQLGPFEAGVDDPSFDDGAILPDAEIEPVVLHPSLQHTTEQKLFLSARSATTDARVARRGFDPSESA